MSDFSWLEEIDRKYRNAGPIGEVVRPDIKRLLHAVKVLKAGLEMISKNSVPGARYIGIAKETLEQANE